jgi:hypothetical protein
VLPSGTVATIPNANAAADRTPSATAQNQFCLPVGPSVDVGYDAVDVP